MLFKVNLYWVALIAAAVFIVAKVAFGLTWSWWILPLIILSPWVLILALVALVAIIGAVMLVVVGFIKGLSK